MSGSVREMTRGSAQVDDGDVEAFRRDGVVCLRNVFESDWLDLVARGIRRNLEDPALAYKDVSAKGSTGRYLTGCWNWSLIPEFREFALHSPAGAIAGALMGSDLCVFVEDNWFVKEPGAVGRTPWHQDEPYYHTRGDFCSVWLPLEPLAAAEAIEFVRGSHLWGKMFMPANFEDETPRDRPSDVGGVIYELTPDVEADRRGFDIVSWALEPGDCVVFTGRTLHGAPANASSGKVSRRLSTRWADGGTRFFDKGYSWTSFVADHGLRDGDLLRGEKFPVVWQRAG